MELLLQPPKPIEDRFRLDAEIVLFHGDVSEFLAQIPDRSVTLIITSPPYNLGKEYENRVAIEQYLQAQAEVIAQLYRVLREDGSICWQVGNFVTTYLPASLRAAEGGEAISRPVGRLLRRLLPPRNDSG